MARWGWPIVGWWVAMGTASCGAVPASFAQGGVGSGFPPVVTTEPPDHLGERLGRALFLLSDSTPQRRHRVKVLFYGQSITLQPWWREVERDMRARFPHADLVVENRAIGGFDAARLVKVATNDLDDAQPDLVILHVYGSESDTDQLLRIIRSRTVADVLIQTDHLNLRDAPANEGTASKRHQEAVERNTVTWPALARRHQTEWVPQFTLWESYLKDHGLSRADLLKDTIHLNDHGCFLMAELVKPHLRVALQGYDPSHDDRVTTWWIGAPGGPRWESDGTLRWEFEGTRIDAILASDASGLAHPVTRPLRVTIDGGSPARVPGAYVRTRTTSFPGMDWPSVLRVGAEAVPKVEEWTLTLTSVPNPRDLTDVTFRLEGSKTGFDGEGTSRSRFVSKSGRVTIDPGDWKPPAPRWYKEPGIAPGETIRWWVKPRFVETLMVRPGTDPTRDNTQTLVQGLPNGRHVLELRDGPAPALKGLRVFRPPLGRRPRA